MSGVSSLFSGPHELDSSKLLSLKDTNPELYVDPPLECGLAYDDLFAANLMSGVPSLLSGPGDARLANNPAL